MTPSPGALFLDSSGWFAALSPAERAHSAARALYDAAISHGSPLITTPLVVAEVHTLVLRWRGPRLAAAFLGAAFDGTVHHVVSLDAGLFDAAVERWIRRFADQRFSLCDGVSFEVMRQRRMTSALTLDAHFEHAGFRMLPDLAPAPAV